MSNPNAEKAEAPKPPRLDPVIVDLGKQKKKKIRQLRKGRGTLFSKVMETHAELKDQGDGGGPIIVVVNAKKRKRGPRWLGAILLVGGNRFAA